MKKFLITFSIVLLIIFVLLGIGYLTFRGKMPILSDMVLKQVDLGIDESPDVIYAFYDDIQFVDNLKGDTPKSGTLVFEGGIDLDHTFTQSEINSWFSAWEKSWTGIPFQNLQVRLNPDGTVEASSLITVSEAESIGRTLGYTDEEIAKAKTYLEYIPDPLPLYAKGTASVTEDDVMIDIDSFKIANFNIPSSLAGAIGGVIEDVIERTRHLSDDTTIKSAIVTAEGVQFVGTVPASVSIQ